MALIGAVSPEMMEQIVRYVTRQIVSGAASEDPESELGIHFINTTGEEIPPYGVFQAHETRNDVFMPAVVIAKKPIDAAANASAIFVNGPNAVENNGFGYAQPGPLYKVLHDGTAAAGDDLGLTDDSFEASPGSGPFVAIGEDDVSENVFLCLLAAGSGSVLYFVLAEDANTSEAWVWAKPGDLDEVTSVITATSGEKFKLYFWMDILRSPKYAKAGYAGIYGKDDNGRWAFKNGPCITGCQATGSIDLESIPDGVVDEEYSHTVDGTDIDESTIDVQDLPDGLTYDSMTQEISGTPTTAGTTQITVSATDDDGCVITKIVDFVVTETPPE